MSQDKNITVRDIAKEANVSVATVSRVLNKSNRVTRKTQEKVQKVIDKYDFKPNAVARSLYKKETKVIGCILPDITNQYFSQMFREIENYAHDVGYSVLLCNSTNSLEMESHYINKLSEQQVDGYIIMGGISNEISPNEKNVNMIKTIAKEKPVIIINGSIDDNHVYMINTDDFYAIDQMVKFLSQKGCKRIKLIGGLERTNIAVQKKEAFYKAVEKYALDVKECTHIYGEFDAESGYKIMKQLLIDEAVMDAVLAVNDDVAIGALHALHEHGMQIPNDIAVIGYDDSISAKYAFPPLTTYAHPYKEMGKFVIDTLERLASGESVVNVQLVRGNIVQRKSV